MMKSVSQAYLAEITPESTMDSMIFAELKLLEEYFSEVFKLKIDLCSKYNKYKLKIEGRDCIMF